MGSGASFTFEATDSNDESQGKARNRRWKRAARTQSGGVLLKGGVNNIEGLGQKKRGLASDGKEDGAKKVRDIDLGLLSGDVNTGISTEIGDISQSRREL